MAKFEFKFDAVLHQRKVAEETKQRELAMLLREKHIIESQLRSMQQAISADKREMADALRGSVDVGRIRQHAAHAGQVTVRARQMAVRLMALHKQIETARAALLQAAKARKAIELLYDKQFSRWRKAIEKRESAMLDEIATQAYSRRGEVTA